MVRRLVGDLRPERVIRLSIAAALVTMALKLVAFALTGSVALLSDALESVVNLVAALAAWWALRIAASPPDLGHPNGHEKAELLSTALEGALVIVAGVAIAWAAVARLREPQPLHAIGLGVAASVAAAVVNGVVASILLASARASRSRALEADARHLLTDVWTTVAALGGLGLVASTGISALDPIMAIAISLHVVWTGAKLLRDAMRDLMDASVPDDERASLVAALDVHRSDEVTWHGLRTRRAGRRAHAVVHVLVPGSWTVERAHDLSEAIQSTVAACPHPVELVVHVEPREDPRAWADEGPGDLRSGGSSHDPSALGPGSPPRTPAAPASREAVGLGASADVQALHEDVQRKAGTKR